MFIYHFHIFSYVHGDSGVVVPSHFYLILMKCSTTVTYLDQCPPEQLEILSFALPHKNKTDNCLVCDFIQYLLINYIWLVTWRVGCESVTVVVPSWLCDYPDFADGVVSSNPDKTSYLVEQETLPEIKK